MKYLAALSIKHPKKVLAAVGIITVIMVGVFIDRFAIEINPSKSFSRDLDVIKFYNLTLKKFGMKDMVLLGIENDEGVYNIETLRYIERVIHKLENLKIRKTYDSLITGKTESIEVPSEIDADDIMSIINADDMTVDKSTNTLVVGNLTSRARKKAGMTEIDELSTQQLPRDNAGLDRLIPFLQKELRNNDLYRGTLISEDEKACAILVPIERNIDIKGELLRKELYVMISACELRSRFTGHDYFFPHAILNRTINGITVDEKYTEEIAAANRDSVRDFALDLFGCVKKQFPDFYASLQKNEVNAEYVDSLLKMIESDRLYETEANENSYADMIDELYSFVLENIDAFSRDNLEERVYSVKDGVDVGLLYDMLTELVEKDKPENINTYIAGMPVAQALIERFVVGDMSVFLNVTIIVIIAILFLSFRNATGMILPLASVGIGTVWVMATLLLSGMKISSGTIALPTILIAVGSSYVIHYLSRYFETVQNNPGITVRDAIIKATESIHVAILLCAVTTLSAFMSNVPSTGIIDIKMLSLLTSLGIVVTVVLTFSFVPAVLILMPLPVIKPDTRIEKAMDNLVMNGGKFTYEHSKAVFLISMLVLAIAMGGLAFLKTESSITYFFRDDNPLRVSSKFIDSKLTGTGQMAIVIKMRDRVSLDSIEAKKDLTARIDDYAVAYRNLVSSDPGLSSSRAVNRYFMDGILEMKKNPAAREKDLENRIAVMKDALNEYYESAAAADADTGKAAASSGGMLDIMSLSDSSALASSGGASPVEEGINDIAKRMGGDFTTAANAETKRFIRAIRLRKNTETGRVFLRKFNTLSDFFVTDISQPVTLKKIDELSTRLKNLSKPKARIDGKPVKPVGKVISITDTIKLVYKVFYHDDNEQFNKLPDVDRDNIADRTLTDRDIMSVCISQFSGSSPDNYKSMATTDMKLMQYMVFARSDTADFLKKFNDAFLGMAKQYFPENDPYVEKIVVSGLPAINMTMNHMLFTQQIQSIVLTLGVVFLCCVFMLRSFLGGLMCIVPITMTVLINLGIMGWYDFPINYSTVLIASIAIGAGIDYSIHFVERFKIEYRDKGNDFQNAYFNTLNSTGRSIVVSSLSVGLGFGVLMLSTFKMLSTSGLMVALAMILAATAALTTLPALLNWLKPEFLMKQSGFKTRNKNKE